MTLTNTQHLHNHTKHNQHLFRKKLSLFCGADTLAQEAVHMATPSPPPASAVTMIRNPEQNMYACIYLYVTLLIGYLIVVTSINQEREKEKEEVTLRQQQSNRVLSR